MSRQAERAEEESRSFTVVSGVFPLGTERFFLDGSVPAQRAETPVF